MIYAISDIHGCIDAFTDMIKKIKLSEDDTLLVLGDSADRSPDGIMVWEYCMKHKNIIHLLGNHDMTAKIILSRLEKDNGHRASKEFWQRFSEWRTYDGGAATLDAFQTLSQERRDDILRYIDSFLPYYQVTVGDCTFFCSHTLPTRSKLMQFEKCKLSDFTLGEPEYEKVYFKDKYCITGHTPTNLINHDSKGSIIRQNNHIAIDCGACYGGRLGCICLDTMEEFYE